MIRFSGKQVRIEFTSDTRVSGKAIDANKVGILIEASNEDDAKEYFYPWHTVDYVAVD